MTDEKENQNIVKSDDDTTNTSATGSETASQQANESTSAADLFTAKPLPKMQAKKSSRKIVFPVLVSLLLILALASSGWSLYQQQNFGKHWVEVQTKIDDQLSNQSKQIEQIQSNNQAALQAINQTQIQLNQYTNKYQQLTESLLSTQEKIKALSGRQKHDWMVAEAAYLIKVAEIQLHLQKDRTTAIQLLKTADSRIIETADNNLLPIREAIAQDLSDLNLIIEPDVTGMSYMLDAIIKQIPSLEITALHYQPLEKELSEPLVEKDEFDLNEIYQKFLKDFVVIKDHSEPVKPLMKEDQRINLVNNVQLALQQAQIALAKSNNSIYQLNMDNANLWLKTYFKQDETTLSLIEQVIQLKSMPVEAKYPNQLNSKKALEEINQAQLYHWLESSNTNSNIQSAQENGEQP